MASLVPKLPEGPEHRVKASGAAAGPWSAGPHPLVSPFGMGGITWVLRLASFADLALCVSWAGKAASTLICLLSKKSEV